MHSFEVSKEIKGPLEEVWALLDRYSDTWVYHPMVEKSEAVNGKKTGLGAQRQCTMYNGDKVQERITRYEPDKHQYDLSLVVMGPMPLKEMHVSIFAESAGEKRSRVTYAGSFTPKFGPLGWVMAKLMMKSQFEKMMGQLIDGIENHLESGRVVGKGGRLEATLAPQQI